MSRTFITLLALLLLTHATYAQKCRLLLKTNWYANVHKGKHYEQDTLILYRTSDSLDKKTDILQWRHHVRHRFQPIHNDMHTAGFNDPTIYTDATLKLRHHTLHYRNKHWHIRYSVQQFCDSTGVYKMILIRQG